MAIKDFFSSREAYSVFRNNNFRYFIWSKFMLTFALNIQFVVLSWQVYEITKDPLSLGYLGLAEAFPAVTFALYGGYTADRLNRRKILIAVISSLFLCTGALLFISLHFTGENKLTTALPFYAIMFVIGIGRAFYSPAQFSLMTQLITREQYPSSSAWNSTFWHIAVVVGSTLGGLLLGFFGKVFTYAIVVGLIIISIIQIIRITAPAFERLSNRESTLSNIGTGLKFVFQNKIILGAMSLDLVAVLFGGAIAMLPVFAKEILHVEELGFGILRAAPFLGAVMMSLYMTHHPPLKNTGRKLLFSIAGFACCMILFALSKNFYLSFFILAFSGVFDNVSVVIRSMIMQMMTPDNMRGRVSAVSTMFISSSNEIGAFESGVAAKILTLVPSVIFGGCVALASSGLAAYLLPSLRRLQLKDK